MTTLLRTTKLKGSAALLCIVSMLPVPLLDLLLVVSGVLLQKIDVVLGQGVGHFLAPLLVLPPFPWRTTNGGDTIS